jgi:DNA-binding NarL/FixJ family response regulator
VLLPGGGVDGAFRNQLLRNGASGFLPSGCDISIVHRALSAAKEGELWVTRKLLADTFRQAINNANHHRFTTREREILRCLANGYTNHQIGEMLFITRETVRWHLRSIYTKLEVHDRESLVQFIEREGLGRWAELGAD